MQGHDTFGVWSVLRSVCFCVFKHSEFSASVVGGSASDTLMAYSDISFAPTGSRSQSGLLVQRGGSTLTWKSYRQT
eukprot:1878452-Amphidinium_carterae.1